jgi:protein-S-isoprenylcysteine O-methyltransferase Ste14
MIKAILILPFNAVITVPALLLWLTRPISLAAPSQPQWWFALLLLTLGLSLFVATVLLFVRIGKGSLAPWDAPKRFVVAGPYRFMRHPMITGVAASLLAETLLFGSWILAAWTVLFVGINIIYLPFKEEPDLVRRFGDDYRTYMRHVPRWLPRLTPWRPEQKAGTYNEHG